MIESNIPPHNKINQIPVLRQKSRKQLSEHGILNCRKFNNDRIVQNGAHEKKAPVWIWQRYRFQYTRWGGRLWTRAVAPLSVVCLGRLSQLHEHRCSKWIAVLASFECGEGKTATERRWASPSQSQISEKWRAQELVTLLRPLLVMGLPLPLAFLCCNNARLVGGCKTSV